MRAYFQFSIFNRKILINLAFFRTSVLCNIVFNRQIFTNPINSRTDIFSIITGQ